MNFAFLKDPLVVNDVFLKTPRRIEAMGLVPVLSLLLWCLMERIFRPASNDHIMTFPDASRNVIKIVAVKGL